MQRPLHTYRDLRNFLLQLPIDHPIFDQPVQATSLLVNRDALHALTRVSAIGRVLDFDLSRTRNSYSIDGMHEPEDFVFVLAATPGSDDEGETAACVVAAYGR